MPFELNAYRRRTFSLAGPIVWNSLLDLSEIQQASTTDCFRLLLKAHLFA